MRSGSQSQFPPFSRREREFVIQLPINSGFVPSFFNFRHQLLATNAERSYKKASTLAAILILAVLYAAAGRIGLLTAIPPGYVTAIWPSSGIALAAVLLRGKRIWPGIWLGSFAINNWAYVRYTGKPPSLRSVA